LKTFPIKGGKRSKGEKGEGKKDTPSSPPKSQIFLMMASWDELETEGGKVKRGRGRKESGKT